MNAPEIWKPIPGWPYEASSIGRIRRIGGKPRALRRKPTGYAQVVLHNDRQKRGGHVARFVCMAFHGTAPSPDHHVDHIDGDRTNDRPENLRWLHKADNWSRRRLTITRGEAVHNSRLTLDAVREIRAARRRTTALAAKFGVSKTTIKNVRSGKAWAHAS